MKKVETILQYLESHGIAVAEFERKSGLGNSYLTKTKERGVDLSEKILDRVRKNNPEHYELIFGKGANVTEAATARTEQDATVIQGKTSVEKSLENLTENQLRNTAIIERLVTLLEQQFSSYSTRKDTEDGDSTGIQADHPAKGDLSLDKKERRITDKSRKASEKGS